MLIHLLCGATISATLSVASTDVEEKFRYFITRMACPPPTPAVPTQLLMLCAAKPDGKIWNPLTHSHACAGRSPPHLGLGSAKDTLFECASQRLSRPANARGQGVYWKPSVATTNKAAVSAALADVSGRLRCLVPRTTNPPHTSAAPAPPTTPCAAARCGTIWTQRAPFRTCAVQFKSTGSRALAAPTQGAVVKVPASYLHLEIFCGRGHSPKRHTVTVTAEPLWEVDAVSHRTLNYICCSLPTAPVGSPPILILC